MSAIGKEPTHFSTPWLDALDAHRRRHGTLRGRRQRDGHPHDGTLVVRHAPPIVRACFEQCCEWTKLAGSQTVSDLSGQFDEVDNY